MQKFMDDLNRAELRQVILDRLNGLPSIGPTIDVRCGPLPYEWLSDEYANAEESTRNHMMNILCEFIEGLVNYNAWSKSACANLFGLIQECESPELFAPIHNTLHSLSRDNDVNSKDIRAGLIKCLIAFNHRFVPQYLHYQLDCLGSDYGAVIFAAMLNHGLDEATDLIPKFAGSRNAVNWLCLYRSNLYCQFGQKLVQDAFRRVLDKVPEPARSALAAEYELCLAKQPQ